MMIKKIDSIRFFINLINLFLSQRYPFVEMNKLDCLRLLYLAISIMAAFKYELRVFIEWLYGIDFCSNQLQIQLLPF